MLFPSIRTNIGKIKSAASPSWLLSKLPFSRFNYDDSEWNIEDVEASDLSVILARDEKEINYSKQLRYQVFVEEMGAKPDKSMSATGMDTDEFDEYCDHLLVIDNSIRFGNPVVGTYRLMRRSRAKKLGKFYTQSEFDIRKIKRVRGEILELGRSCVHPKYRTRAVMQLLWRGIGAYVDHYNITLMFGCASFAGANVTAHATHLSYLYYNHLAPRNIRAKALPEHYIKMDLVPEEETKSPKVVASLPPLIKGYLRLGGFIGDGAVLDRAYNTTDVCIILKTSLVADRYNNKYRPDSGSKG